MLDGPVCDTGPGYLTWWQVQYGDQTGWVSEGQVTSIWGDNLYWIEPATETPPPPDGICEASPETRLDGATQGQVAQSYSTMWTGIGSLEFDQDHAQRRGLRYSGRASLRRAALLVSGQL